MPSPSLNELKAQYRARAKALAEVADEELAALSDEEALRQIFALECFTDEPPSTSEWSGLVEQQALFTKLRLL